MSEDERQEFRKFIDYKWEKPSEPKIYIHGSMQEVLRSRTIKKLQGFEFILIGDKKIDMKFLRGVGFDDADVRVIDLFCGAGGMSLGVKMACEGKGKSVAMLGIDAELYACATYARNLAPTICADLAKLEFENIIPGYITIMLGGPPCPQYSTMTAGIRKKPHYIDRFGHVRRIKA